MSQSSSFDELSYGVQRWIYRQGWESLRDVQEKSVPIILASKQDVLITAPTAGGKTEAAFLPVVSWIEQNDNIGGYGALCISPLKALINDQYERLIPLCESANTHITPWHGDVSQSQKKKSWSDPSGILMITPESLDAMFVRRPHELKARIENLQYIVIDEYHAFIDRERGQQLLSLLARIEEITERSICRIALSATIGDPAMALSYLRPDASSVGVHIDVENSELKLQLSVKAFSANEDSGVPVTAHMASDLYPSLSGENNLVFGNSRRVVEEIADQLKKIGEHKGSPDQFFVHHGSLSKESRHFVEQRLKSGEYPTTAVATSTLELGIDIGHVATVAQIGAPANVSSVRQRLGRSGRREGAHSILRVLIGEKGLRKNASPIDKIEAELVQSIAVINLMLKRWIEPPDIKALHLSTLIQQLLSMVAYTGGIMADSAYRTLCAKGPWRHLDSDMFARILRGLGKSEVLSQIGNGEIVVGELGEKIVSSHSFYTAFEVPEEYTLVAQGRELGALPVDSPYVPGQLLLFGGQRWSIVEVNDEAKVITLAKAKNGQAPIFGGETAPVHREVRQEMLRVLSDTDVPRYLDKNGEKVLSRARKYFETNTLNEEHVCTDNDYGYFFVWDNDRVLNTLKTISTLAGFAADSVGPCLVIDDPSIDDQFPKALLDNLESIDLEEIKETIQAQPLGKFDVVLPKELLREAYVREKIDIEETINYLKAII